MIEFNPKNIKRWMMMGTRNAFGAFLTEIAADHPKLFAMTADFTKSTGLAKFKELYPNQFLSTGIAEQNMIGTAAGLVEEGIRAICVAQACFITMRSFEQARQYAGYMKLPIIFIGIGSGLSLQYMGNTHYAIEDFALMRTIPGMTVLAPCDALEAMKALEFSVNHDGPVYIRLYGGTGIPSVYGEDYEFKIGTAVKLRNGKDIQLITTGSMTLAGMKVADMLSEEGIDATVTNMHTIKPLDSSAIGLDKQLIVTMEEHSVIGGLGSAVADVLSAYPQHPRLIKFGINDMFMPVGSYAYLLDQAGLSLEKIKESIIRELK